MDNRGRSAFSTERLENSMGPIRDEFWEKAISLHTFESMEGKSSRRNTGVRTTREVNPTLLLEDVAESPQSQYRLSSALPTPKTSNRPSAQFSEDDIIPGDSRSVQSEMSKKSAIPTPLKISNFSKRSNIHGQNPPPVPKLSDFPSCTSLPKPKPPPPARPNSQTIRHSLISEVPINSPISVKSPHSYRNSKRKSSSNKKHESSDSSITALPPFQSSENIDGARNKPPLPMPPNLSASYNSRVSSPPHPGVRPLGKPAKGGNALIREMRRLSIPASDIMYPSDVYINDQANKQRAAFRDFNVKGPHDEDVELGEDGRPPTYRTNTDDNGPPDGGALAWAHAWAGFLGTFNTWGLNTAFGVFQAYYSLVTLYGLPLDKISWIGSTQIFFIFFVGTPVGYFMDRGYFRLFFNGGSLLIVIGLFLTSICTKWWHFFVVQGCVTGLGMGLNFTSGVIILLTWFRRKLGVAMGIAAAGTSVGAIVYTLVFQQLILKLSFGWTVRVMGLIAFVTLIYPNVVVRPRVSPKSATLNRHLQRTLCVADARKSTPQTEDPAAPKIPKGMFLHAINDPPYLLTILGFFLSFWSLYQAFYYMPIFAYIHLHTSPTTSLNLLLAMSAANLPGRFLPGILSDRCMGPLNTLIPACFLSGACLFLWTEVQGYGGLVVVACFYGFCCAGVQALYAAALASFTTGLGNAADGQSNSRWKSCFSGSRKSYACTADPEKGVLARERAFDDAKVAKAIGGLKSGLVFTAISFACLTGSPIGGRLIKGQDESGSFLGLQLFAGASFCGGGLALLAARWAKLGWRPGKA